MFVLIHGDNLSFLKLLEHQFHRSWGYSSKFSAHEKWPKVFKSFHNVTLHSIYHLVETTPHTSILFLIDYVFCAWEYNILRFCRSQRITLSFMNCKKNPYCMNYVETVTKLTTDGSWSQRECQLSHCLHSCDLTWPSIWFLYMINSAQLISQWSVLQ